MWIIENNKQISRKSQIKPNGCGIRSKIERQPSYGILILNDLYMVCIMKYVFVIYGNTWRVRVYEKGRTRDQIMHSDGSISCSDAAFVNITVVVLSTIIELSRDLEDDAITRYITPYSHAILRSHSKCCKCVNWITYVF